MDNQDILERIQQLVEEEHRLRDSSADAGADGAAGGEERAARLRRVEGDLDQCWDLLRQRRAKQNAGEDPGEADARPVDQVEGYRQ
jgi:hypothetical protein